MKQKLIITLCLTCLPLLAQADLVWSVEQADGEHAHHHGRPQQQLLLNESDAQVWRYTPDLVRQAMPLQQRQASLRPSGQENYHLYLAEREEGNLHEAALYYRYFGGRPTGVSPQSLVNLNKTALEIIPNPLPREHRHWLSGNTVQFIIRFQGQPLGGIKVDLHSSNGSYMHVVSDEAGRVSFVLPDDFSDVSAGRRNNDEAWLQLWVEHEQGEQQYRTSLTLPYSVNPTLYWQSQTIGWLLLGSGFVFGLGLVHFKNKDNK